MISADLGSVYTFPTSSEPQRNISDQPAPFIYEKIGTKYNNYFIDEFQDTSELQWKNLIPLTSHALLNEELDSDGGNLFLVGDPKQSIYMFT